MTSAAVDRILRERSFLRSAGDDPELQALRTAILIEDVFGVTLTDEQLGSDLLDDPVALGDLLANRPTSLG